MDAKTDTDPRELELKLVLPPGCGERLAAHALLAELPSETEELHAIYFDGPGLPLRKRGYELRVRRSGEHWIQTLKSGGGAAGLFARGEWEQPVEGPEPDLEALKATPLADAPELLQGLTPQVSTEIRRRTWRIVRRRGEIELAFDEGVVRADGQETPLAELELELKRGAPDLLFGSARKLARRLPLRLGALSKAERGFELAAGKSGKARKAAHPKLRPKATVADGFAQILSSCLAHYRRNEPLIRDLPEALHQGRVALRRLRAAFTLFGKVLRDDRFAELRPELRVFTGLLGEARDLDVFLARHREQLGAADVRRLEAARTRAYTRIGTALEGERLRRLIFELLAWSETGRWRNRGRAQRQIEGFAARRLDRIWAAVSDDAARFDELDEEERHELRIRIKKLRYGVDFLGSLFERKAVKRFLDPLEELQELLGDLNDQVTARHLITEHRLSLRLAGDGTAEEEQLSKVRAQLGRLMKAGPFWRG